MGGIGLCAPAAGCDLATYRLLDAMTVYGSIASIKARRWNATSNKLVTQRL